MRGFTISTLLLPLLCILPHTTSAAEGVGFYDIFEEVLPYPSAHPDNPILIIEIDPSTISGINSYRIAMTNFGIGEDLGGDTCSPHTDKVGPDPVLGQVTSSAFSPTKKPDIAFGNAGLYATLKALDSNCVDGDCLTGGGALNLTYNCLEMCIALIDDTAGKIHYFAEGKQFAGFTPPTESTFIAEPEKIAENGTFSSWTQTKPSSCDAISTS